MLPSGSYADSFSQNACAAQNFQYAYYNSLPLVTALSCYCSNSPPALNALVSATAAVDGALNTGICGTVNYEVSLKYPIQTRFAPSDFQAIRVNTNFDLRACATADALIYTGVGQSATVENAGQCLTRCVASAYALVNQNNGLCTCATGTRVSGVGSLGACATTANGANIAVYFNDIFPVPSRTLRKRDLQKILGLCPTGLNACLVGDSAVGSDAFEVSSRPDARDYCTDAQCLDTRAELESCGGCINGYADIAAGAASVGTE